MDEKGLETELETYEERFSELEAHIGRYVLIHGKEIVGI